MRYISGERVRKIAKRLAILSVCSALSALSVPVSAQEPRARVRSTQPDEFVNVFVNRRARLGIQVNMQARESDSLGAYVNFVTSGGPAEKAGILAGDVITRLDGIRLDRTTLPGKQQKANDDERSLPGLRLIELASRLEPNDTIEVEFRRGTTSKKATLVTSDDPMQAWNFDGPGGPRGFAYRIGPEMERMRLDLESLPRRFPPGAMYFMGPFANLELAPLNADLGQYFGASEGVLVISVPQSSSLNLKGGDVVSAIDGRKPTSPGHLLRILQSYDGGESVKFDIMRSKKRETVTGKIPEREGMWKTRGDGRGREGI